MATIELAAKVAAAPDPEIVIDNLGCLCPVQGDGFINGLPFYFRARGDGWKMSIAQDPAVDPVDVHCGFAQGWTKEGQHGPAGYVDAGYMDYEYARALIYFCALEFVEGSAG